MNKDITCYDNPPQHKSKEKMMKAITLALMIAVLLTAIAETSKAAETASTAPIEYKVVARVDESPGPTALRMTKAGLSENSVNENVAVVSERVLNADSLMLKKSTVQPVGRKGFSSWQLLSDEGGHTYEQSSPNPLSYLTTGISSNLLTQLQRGAKVMGLNVDEMKVEVKVFFRYDDPMTNEWAGYTDKVIANILIDSPESPEKLSVLKAMAMKAWVAGEGLANKTEILPELVINGQHWSKKYSINGNVPDPVSVDNDLTLSHKTDPPVPTTFEVGEDMGMDALKNPAEFVLVAIAESADDRTRPYLQKIRVRAAQENYVGWDLYADDSYEAKGMDKAPTSLDYLTAGTSFCLMSQLTATNMFLKLDIDDYRVEQQINYRQEDFMSPEMAGYADSVITKILVNSKAPEKELNKYSTMSLGCCFAGEAFMNETPISTRLLINGKEY